MLALLCAAFSIPCCAQSPGDPIITRYGNLPDTVTVTWVRNDAVCKKTLHRPGPCAGVDFDHPGKCTIYARPVSDWSDDAQIENIGHELLHCFYGEAHVGLNER